MPKMRYNVELNATGEKNAIIPVPIIQMLPYECVRLHCSIGVDSWQVHIINEVHQPSAACR